MIWRSSKSISSNTLLKRSHPLRSTPSFLFVRLIPGTAEIASINARMLCSNCYMDFGRGSGKQPRPDIYILRFDRRE
ncbi:MULTISPECIES: DUF5402 family protein [Methanococcoides]|uniref:DUF5402 family protein n=1 Tax=Methanococcoides TaxID=2225 RepID=UPI00203312B1|nr:MULTISPECIES: DUF5402 family protein [Methanococcoides]